MQKDFDKWNFLKKEINNRKKVSYIKDGEVWMTHLGLNIDTEMDGVGESFLRPVLIIKRPRFEQLWIVPLTTRENKDYILLDFKYKGNLNYVNILQFKTIDSARLKYNIGKVSEDELKMIKEKIRNLLD